MGVIILASTEGLVYKRYVLEPGASKYHVRKILEELVCLARTVNAQRTYIEYVCNVKRKRYVLHNAHRVKVCGNACRRCERCDRMDRLARRIL